MSSIENIKKQYENYPYPTPIDSFDIWDKKEILCDPEYNWNILWPEKKNSMKT